MEHKHLLSISEFARLSGIKRKNLIFYDEIGLFSPAYTDVNRYRYYTYRQLDTANLIWALKEIGMPLKEIRQYTIERTPQKMIELFKKQKVGIEAEINKLQKIQEMMESYISITESVQEMEEEQITLQFFEREPIGLGTPIDYSDGKTPADAIADFYNNEELTGFVTSYPMGALISAENLWANKGQKPDRYYFRMKDGKDYKPEGCYAVGYGKGNYGTTDATYEKMLAYIEEHYLKVAGDSYEEYLINEISVRDPDEYLFRVLIPVQRL